MGKPKSLKDKLWGAAVLKMSFRLRGAEESPAFKGVYPGVLRDLVLEDKDVEKYIVPHRLSDRAQAQRRFAPCQPQYGVPATATEYGGEVAVKHCPGVSVWASDHVIPQFCGIF